MKHLLNGVAVAAALAIAAPVWAQNPSGGNPMGTPGPSPGGPGLTPYSSGPAPAPAPSAMPSAAAAPPSTSAAPPMHRPLHPVHHTRAMHGFHKGMSQRAASAGDTTAALNREELARIHSGDLSNPPPPPPPAEAPPSGGMGGPKTSGSSGAGPR